jgi:hypothetical protein
MVFEPEEFPPPRTIAFGGSSCYSKDARLSNEELAVNREEATEILPHSEAKAKPGHF